MAETLTLGSCPAEEDTANLRAHYPSIVAA